MKLGNFRTIVQFYHKSVRGTLSTSSVSCKFFIDDLLNLNSPVNFLSEELSIREYVSIRYGRATRVILV